MKQSKVQWFDETITIEEARLKNDHLGEYDEKTATIRIEKDQPEVGKHIVLIHEILHLADASCKVSGVTKRRQNHDFITAASPFILHVLLKAGYYSGINENDYDSFMSEMSGENTP